MDEKVEEVQVSVGEGSEEEVALIRVPAVNPSRQA